MREIKFSADELVSILLSLENERNLCLLDSCGVSHLNSHLLIAGINPVEVLEISEPLPEKTLSILDEKLSQKDLAAMLTISYDFGLKLNRITPRQKETASFPEPDFFLALFDVLIVHDYNLQKTFLTGNENKFDEIEQILISAAGKKLLSGENSPASQLNSNFTRREYLTAVEKVQEFIRRGDTYQTNLTQQFQINLPANLRAENVFFKLRKEYPAPFAAFLRRRNDIVISASPERFFKVQNLVNESLPSQIISVSPIKGTRPRGKTLIEDENLRDELLNSEKDRAENVMIVDLLRNDIGRICEYGSVEVEKLCDIEEHPTLFHLVSTVSGKLRNETTISDILRAVFPCGSITGAPKIRTMQIIDELETAPRGLSMGAIGIMVSDQWREALVSGQKEVKSLASARKECDQRSMINDKCFMDFSVAIRTMTLRGNQAVFNVGGGITIDSILEDEYEETLVKAKALLSALNAKFSQKS